MGEGRGGPVGGGKVVEGVEGVGAEGRQCRGIGGGGVDDGCAVYRRRSTTILFDRRRRRTSERDRSYDLHHPLYAFLPGHPGQILARLVPGPTGISFPGHQAARDQPVADGADGVGVGDDDGDGNAGSTVV